MKTLGETSDGGAIVEMDRYEHELLSKLEQAVREETPDQVFGQRAKLRGDDLSLALRAIATWVSLKRDVTALKKGIESFQAALEDPAL